MPKLILSTGETIESNQGLITIGTDEVHDLRVVSEVSGLVASLISRPGRYEVLASRTMLKVNGQPVGRSRELKHFDRIEWGSRPDQAVLYLADGVMMEVAAEKNGAAVLGTYAQLFQAMAERLEADDTSPAVFAPFMDRLLTVCKAEVGHLVMEASADGGWELLCMRLNAARAMPLDRFEAEASRSELFSHTVLQEAIKKRAIVYIGSIVGHAWSTAASVVAARIQSAACIPLCVGSDVLGAIYLVNRTPGRPISQAGLEEAQLFATQAALLLSLRSRRLGERKPKGIASNQGFVVGESLAMNDLVRKITKLAPTPLSVLITGETGTGKERVAQELHRLSPRSDASFVAVNCAAIPATLLESTLFGYEKGAFTGATKNQPGKIMGAQGGTLFLDEIGDLAPELQAKLLRVLQEKAVEPVGSHKAIPVDFRLVAATHVNLEKAVAEGRFRQDLYYRLTGAVLRIPPLRERREDLLRLAHHFLKCENPKAVLSKDAEEKLRAHQWPGNVRELEQVVVRAVHMAEQSTIRGADIEIIAVPSAGLSESDATSTGVPSDLGVAQAHFTRTLVEKTLAQSMGNRGQAAQRLGISERTLYRILAQGTDDFGRTL